MFYLWGGGNQMLMSTQAEIIYGFTCDFINSFETLTQTNGLIGTGSWAFFVKVKFLSVNLADCREQKTLICVLFIDKHLWYNHELLKTRPDMLH